MHKKINIRWVKWIDGVSLEKTEIYKIVKKYDFHELDIEACFEENQKARIDVYDDYIFLILHFPKYNLKTKSYELNEFNIFLWKDFIITFRDHEGIHIDTIFDKYTKLDIDDNAEIKITSWFILYEIIQAMLEKMFKLTANVMIDIKSLENKVFEKTSAGLVKNIMIKKRNIWVLKYMFKPQILVLKTLENHINLLFKWKMEVYFEDLEDKLEQIVSDIMLLEEHIDSIEDAFKTIVDINTNFTVKLLTIFSAFLLPLTLITSFYGMNIDLPLQNSPQLVFIILIMTLLFMWMVYMILRKKGKI